LVFVIYCFILAISNADRLDAFNDCHPDRRKVLDRIGFAFHLEPKQDQTSSEKRLTFSPRLSTTFTDVKINQNDKTQE
jgi:hypothetical protein